LGIKRTRLRKVEGFAQVSWKEASPLTKEEGNDLPFLSYNEKWRKNTYQCFTAHWVIQPRDSFVSSKQMTQT